MARKTILLTTLLLFVLTTSMVSAASLPPQTSGQEYIVQAGDWLSKLAEKYYGDAQAWPIIVEATNAKAATDSSFATISDPDLIEVGQKLWIPDVDADANAEIAKWNAGLSVENRKAKYLKMASSAHTFYRGTNHLFWADFAGDERLSRFGNAKTITWLQGDLHTENFGAFDNDKGEVVYNVNDFDESIIADYQYDVWRMAVSLVLVARENGNLSREQREDAIDAFTESYLDTLASYRDNNEETVVYFTKDNTYGRLDDFLKEVEGDEDYGRAAMLNEWTLEVDHIRHFDLSLEKDGQPKLGKPTSQEREDTLTAMADYGKTLAGGLEYAEDHFKVKDIARRLFAGTGSLGRPRYYVLIEGENPDSNDDDRILDVKQQSKPTPYHYLSEEERIAYDRSFENDAQRHAAAYLALTKHTDDHLGWMQLSDGYYSVRELSPFKESLDTDKLNSEKRFIKLAEQWGIVLATAHARADKDFDEKLVPYSLEKQVDELTDGRHEEFRALVREVAFEYADQVEADWNNFKFLESVTTVLLVRHADRANGSLSEAGQARAEKLAHVAR